MVVVMFVPFVMMLLVFVLFMMRLLVMVPIVTFFSVPRHRLSPVVSAWEATTDSDPYSTVNNRWRFYTTLAIHFDAIRR
jgi:hypothetical protein